MATSAARQGDCGAAGAAVVTTKPVQIRYIARSPAATGVTRRAHARLAEQVEDGFDVDF